MALAFAIPSGAAPLDDMTDAQKGVLLVEVLRRAGVSVDDPKQAVLLAQVMCFSLRQGQSVPSVISDVADTAGWDLEDAGFFYGAGTRAFCAEFGPPS